MPQRIGRRTIALTSPSVVAASAAVGGKTEADGPLGARLDKTYPDALCGRPSWEQAENQLQKDALDAVLAKASLTLPDLDLLFAGDLLSQCIGSSFALANAEIPFVGLYGACSTMAESLAMAACFVSTGLAARAGALTSSHFCASERQFRFPLEYGSQRTPTAQWTATAAGAAIVANAGRGPTVRAVTFGKIRDYGITDANNMGAAMAPAAADTLLAYFRDTGSKPADFDLVLTGDLGSTGSRLLAELLDEQGCDLAGRHGDCGLLLYDPSQDVGTGGSGCGCSAAVLCSKILPALHEGELKRVLFVATGALLSLTSSQQGLSIPGVAHLVELAAPDAP